jgi:hypothetical protein
MKIRRFLIELVQAAVIAALVSSPFVFYFWSMKI